MTVLDQLKETYKSNNQLILFGEAKNVGLIVFNGAIIIGMASVISGSMDFWLWIVMIYVIAMNGISVLIALSSLAAQKRPKPFKSDPTMNENYLFYGTISRLKPEDYLMKIQEKYNLESLNPKLEFDLARQLVIISQIASRKFTRFNFALACTIMSIVTPIGYLIYYYGFYPNRRRE